MLFPSCTALPQDELEASIDRVAHTLSESDTKLVTMEENRAAVSGVCVCARARAHAEVNLHCTHLYSMVTVHQFATVEWTQIFHIRRFRVFKFADAGHCSVHIR